MTMTVPGAVEVIRDLSVNRLDVIQGAGTVLHVETARRCLDAGALFLTSPGFDPEDRQLCGAEGWWFFRAL